MVMCVVFTLDLHKIKLRWFTWLISLLTVFVGSGDIADLLVVS